MIYAEALFTIEKSFQLLKKRMTKKPVLKLSDFNHLFQVRCDDRGTTIAVVLSQKGKVVAYFSDKLSDSK